MWSPYKNESMRREAFLEAARGEIGKGEVGGNNRGPDVEKYQGVFGYPNPDQPWCLYFIQWCLLSTGSSALARTGSCARVWDLSPEKLRLSSPRAGAIAILRSVSGSGGHAMIIEEILPDGNVCTIEGNTSGGAGVEREGDVVARKTHDMTKLKGFTLVGYLDPWESEEVS